jgi:hypothetical protein
MNSWGNIFSLLASLSKSEKRHFKLLASLQEGEKKYLTLFDELEKTAAQQEQPFEWNDAGETLLKNRLIRKGISGQLHVLRNYLASMILKSLRLQEENRTAADEARTKMRESVIMQRKGLYQPAVEKCTDALEMAEQYELFDIEVEALAHLCYLKSQQNLKNYREELERICQKLEAAAAQLETEARYRSLHYQIFALSRLQANPDAPEISRLLNALESDERLAARPEGAGFQARVYYHSALANIAYARRDKTAAKIHNRSILHLWEQHPRQIEEKPRNYIIAIANYLNLCISSGDWTDFEQYLEKMKAVRPVFFDDKAEAFQNIALTEQLYFLNTAQLEKAEALIPYIEQGLSEFKAKVNRAREITLRNNILTTYFANGNYTAALEYTQVLANLGRSEHRVDIQSMTGIWRLIFHYELRHDKYLDLMVKNVTQNLRDNDRLYDFERLVMSHMNRIAQVRMKNLSKTAEQEATRANFLLFRDAMQQFSEKQGSVKILGFEEVAIWVDSHCTGKSFVEILRER